MAGSYKVRLKLGTAKAEQDVRLMRARSRPRSVSLGAGIIEASGVFSAGGPAVPDSATIELRKARPALTESTSGLPQPMERQRSSRFRPENIMVHFHKDYARGSALVEVTAAGVSKVEVAIKAAIWRFQARRIQPSKSSRPRRIFPASASTSRPNMAARSTRPSLRGATM